MTTKDQYKAYRGLVYQVKRSVEGKRPAQSDAEKITNSMLGYLAEGLGRGDSLALVKFNENGMNLKVLEIRETKKD